MKKQNFNRELVKNKIKELGLNYKDLAMELTENGTPISESAIKIWFRTTNPSTPELDKIKALSSVLSLEVSSIIDEVYVDDENDGVELLEMRAGFGTEGTLDPDFKVERCIKLPQEFLGKVNAKYAKIIQCYGDSMMPEFNDGDYILVEMLGGRDYIKRPSIYLVRLGDVVYIKRIEFLPNNDIRLISINPTYPPFLASETGYEWEILGAVYGKISVKLGSGFQFSEQGVKGK